VFSRTPASRHALVGRGDTASARARVRSIALRSAGDGSGLIASFTRAA
jgi:hypothetical protein